MPGFAAGVNRKHTGRLSPSKMSSLRLLSSAARRASSFSIARRGYADVSDKLSLSLTLPHKVRITARTAIRDC